MSKEHICNQECPKYDHYKIFYDGSFWEIEAGDGYHNIFDIKYCPFCGVKLK